MLAGEDSRADARAARFFPPWETDSLPAPPRFSLRSWTMLIGPGLLLAGANIGGGEWLFGPIVTARYGASLMWLATLSIAFQVFYNLSIMRYTLYTGEPVFVGFFRTAPGPRFWTVFYLMVDLGGIWPYLAANAAVPLVAAFIGRLPGPEEAGILRTVSYCIFLCALLPLIFGGKIYNAVERVMVAKIVLVLGFLGFVGITQVSWDTWVAVFSGFVKFGSLPAGEVDWATIAAFASIAGAGGLANLNFSNYSRDKGWGMGSRVGALPSLVGGRKITLSHVGKVFPITEENLTRWRGWTRHILRDQLAIWAVGCLLGMALPSLLSLEFIPGAEVEGQAAAAMTARGIADRSGEIFWFLTLLCGFIVLAPGQITDIDGIVRRWTDVIWTGHKGVRRLKGGQVRYVYYGIMTVYALWGLLALRLTPDPLVLAIATGVLRNIGLGATSLHVLYVNRNLLPPAIRPPLFMQAGLAASFVFFMGISVVVLRQQLERLFGG